MKNLLTSAFLLALLLLLGPAPLAAQTAELRIRDFTAGGVHVLDGQTRAVEDPRVQLYFTIDRNQDQTYDEASWSVQINGQPFASGQGYSFQAGIYGRDVILDPDFKLHPRNEVQIQLTDLAGRVTSAIFVVTYTPRHTGPLPVTLTRFSGARDHGLARLTWATAEEVGFQEFQIEGSLDGQSFSRLGIVPASGHGDQYSFVTGSPSAYFRLRLLDSDGTSHFSPVVHLSTSSEGPGDVQLIDYLGRALPASHTGPAVEVSRDAEGRRKAQQVYRLQ